MRPVFTIHPDQQRNPCIQPAQNLQTLFTVGFPRIFLGQHRRIESDLAIRQVNLMLVDIG